MSLGPDRVQVVKRESSAGGGDGAEDFDFTTTLDPLEDVIECAGVVLQAPSEPRDETVFIERDAGLLRFRDQENTTPRTLSELLAHETLDSLVHELAESSYVKVTRSGGLVTNITVWTSAAMLVKVRETAITRSGGQVSQIVETQYDGAGSAVQTLTHDVSRVGGRVDAITTTET